MIFKSKMNIALKLIHFMREYKKANPDTFYLTNEFVAASIDINVSYAELIMRALKELGIVSAKRGPGGGYYLSNSNIYPYSYPYIYENITLFELKAAFYPEDEDASYINDSVLNMFLGDVVA